MCMVKDQSRQKIDGVKQTQLKPFELKSNFDAQKFLLSGSELIK